MSDEQRLIKPVMEIPIAASDMGRTVVQDQEAGFVYILGGRNFRSIEAYNVNTHAHFFRPPLRYPRSHHASVMRHDRRIYTTGGFSVTETTTIYHRTAEVYDIYTCQSTSIPHMPGAKAYHDIVEDAHGDIIVFGGVDENSDLDSSIYGYKPTEKQWDNLSPLPVPLLYYSWCLDDQNHLYVIGGQTIDRQVVNTLWIYDIDTDQWSQGEAMHSHRYDTHVHFCHTARMIYVIGGSLSTTESISFVEVYDIDKDIWIVKEPMPHYQAEATFCAQTDTQLVLTGGLEHDEKGRVCVSSKTVMYDVCTDTWTRRPDLNVPCVGHISGTTRQGHTFVVGNMFKKRIYRYIDVFDADKNMWVENPVTCRSIASSYGHSMTWLGETFTRQLEIFYIGGVDAYGCVLDRVYGYMPKIGQHVEYTPLPKPLHRHDTFLDPDNNILYIVGGLQANGYLSNTVYAYHIDDDTWHELNRITIYRLFSDFLESDKGKQKPLIKRWNILSIDPFYKKMVRKIQFKS